MNEKLRKIPFKNRIGQAIPFNLRAHRELRPGDFIDTPQGPVLFQIESRLHTIIEENGFSHYQEALDELDVIKARIIALRKEHEAYVATFNRTVEAPKPCQTDASLNKQKVVPKTDDEALANKLNEVCAKMCEVIMSVIQRN